MAVFELASIWAVGLHSSHSLRVTQRRAHIALDAEGDAPGRTLVGRPLTTADTRDGSLSLSVLKSIAVCCVHACSVHMHINMCADCVLRAACMCAAQESPMPNLFAHPVEECSR